MVCLFAIMMTPAFAFISSRDDASEIHADLKANGQLITELKPMPYGDKIAFPVRDGDLELNFESVEKDSPHSKLSQILDNPPLKWEILGDVVIFPEGSKLGDSDLSSVAEALGCTRVAIQAEIDSGMMRKSNLELIHGDDGWVVHKENFVDYEFDITKVMFSSGNITERRRMGEFDMTGETIVDAYCGIGYYSIPMLARSNATHVHACEINPDSITALQKGLARNGVSQRCTIHRGDNRDTLQNLWGIADRVVLGLIPSSQPTWASAIKCLKPSGGIIHVHMNVEENEIEEWIEKTLDWFSTVSGKTATASHFEKVKWYCPHIRHVVLDIKIS